MEDSDFEAGGRDYRPWNFVQNLGPTRPFRRRDTLPIQVICILLQNVWRVRVNGVGKCVAEHVTKGAMVMVTGRIH